MRLLVLMFLVLPLAGCLVPAEEPPMLAGEAVYQNGDWTLHVRLSGPVRALMGDGSYREANLLEAWYEGSVAGVTSMALDGDLRSLWRYDECLYHGLECDSPAQVDWTAHGRLGLYGVGWTQTGPWQRVEHERWDAPIERDGDALVVRRDPDAPRAAAAGLVEGRYEYGDGGLFPTRIVYDGSVLERVSWTPSGPLAPVPVYEPVVPPTGAGGLFPGADEAVFSNGSAQRSFDALRAHDEAGAALAAGCLERVDFARQWAPASRGLAQLRDSEEFTFGVGGPERGAWVVERSWDGVLPDEYEVRRTAPGVGLGPCQARPEAQVTPREFWDAGAGFRPDEPRFARLSFQVGTFWTRDASSAPVAWMYEAWDESGSRVWLEMDAHSGAWRVWRLPVERVGEEGLVQAAAAVVSSLRNQ